MDSHRLIDQYLAGAEAIRQSVAGLNDAQLDATPIPGMWSIRQVVCHLADFEPIYADRMKRVIAEVEPRLAGGDPDLFAASLAYAQRSVEEELQIIQHTRQQMARILQTVAANDFERIGIHLEAGPLTLVQLLQNITGHIPHHLRFVEAKRRAMAV